MLIDQKRRRLMQFAGLAPIAALTEPNLIKAVNLPAQRTTRSAFKADVEIALKASITTMPVLRGAHTKVWKFSGSLLKGPADTLRQLPGSYLGPTLHFRRGQKVRIRFYNELPGECIVH